jgi:hypothetical protein
VKSAEQLASYRRCTERICSRWSDFQELRRERLRERERYGHSAERVTEGIVEDLFTQVLDWSVGDVNHQVGYSDLMLTRLGIKHLILEAKAPGALAQDRRAIVRALGQARRYASEQRVSCIAVSDGAMLYAADVTNGGLRERVYCSLVDPEPQESLWWLSREGIYRECDEASEATLALLPEADRSHANIEYAAQSQLLHPKYKLPASCFAYVGDAADVQTWCLPYLHADGSVDVKRLPKAIQAILTNYRGTHVKKVPESAVADVLVRLAIAAQSIGKLPEQSVSPARAYLALVAALEQLDRMEVVRNAAP